VRTSSARILPAVTVAAVLAAVPIAGPALASPAPFSTCASDGKFTVKSVDVEPQPLVPGKKVTVAVSGTLAERLTDGTYSADVRYRGFEVAQRSGSLRDVTPLPAGPGPVTVGATLDVPRRTPAGSYELRFSAADQNGATLTCLVVPFRVR
jgi:hypothetical protein